MRTRPNAAMIKCCTVLILVTLVSSVTAAVMRTIGRQDFSLAATANGPAIGTVADLTWGVSRAEMDRTIAAMRDAGITWVRANQNWAAAEPDVKSVLNQGWLAEIDYAVSRAGAAGMQVLMPISDGVPYWASADPAKYVDAAGVRHWNKLWRPTNVSDYASFASVMVNRYKSLGVRTWEVWNEENTSYFWPSGPSATEYTALLSAAYPAIKAADPTAKVILGGLSKNDYDYIDALYAAGAGKYFDAANVHPYTGAVDPTWCWNQAGTTRYAKDAFCGIEEVYRSMVANGDSAKSIWLTEFGWSTTTAAYGVSEATQATFLTAAVTKIQTSYPYVTHAFWYNFRNTFYLNDNPTDIEANWGLLRTDYSAKPALAAISAFGAPRLPATISISDPTAVAGAAGITTNATFTVSLSARTDRTVTVKAATANSSAVAGSDYTALALTTLSFAPGETTKAVVVPIIGDSVAEGDETFVVNLSSPTEAVLADAQGVGTILDPLGAPAFSINDVSALEGALGAVSSATFTVSLSAPTDRTVTVKAASANGSAVAGSDYTALALTTLSFVPGETTKTVTVAVTGDAVAEGNETFVVNLSSPTWAVLADSQGLAIILDPLGAPAISVNDATTVAGTTGTITNAIFTVSLSAPAERTVTVKAATANSSAVAGSDYTALASTILSFGPGETTKTVAVPITGDSVAEGNETFVVNLSSPTGAVLADSQGLGTILDSLGAPAISINDVSTIEGALATITNATFTVSLSAPTDRTVTVKAASANGSAVAGSDYTALALTTLSFAPGETTKKVVVAVTGDAVAEGNETFVVNLSSPAGAVLADGQGLATIGDPPGLLGLLSSLPPPSLAVNDVTVVSGAPGSITKATFAVSLSEPAPLLGATVKAATANGSAVAGSDYTALASTTLSFAAGETTKTVTVDVTGDSVAEPSETFVVNLSSPTGAVLADSQGLGTILDPLGPPAFSVNDVSAFEAGSGSTTNAIFTIALSAPTDRVVTVKAATANGSAVAGSDYTALALTTLSFAPGETTKTVVVAVTGDAVAEGNETFVVNLSSPTGAALSDGQGQATILDRLGVPGITISDSTAVGGTTGTTTTNATFTVSLSAPAERIVTVKAATANNSAVAGSDYTALASTTLSFAPGETTKTVVVAVTADSVIEPSETFVVNLSSPTGAVLADPQGLATILDPLGAPAFSINDVSAFEAGSGSTTTAAFTISLSGPTDRVVTVKATTANGSAVAGSDYTALALTTLSFAPGEKTKTVTVAVIGDSLAEGNETFMVNLSSPAGAALSDAQGLATIIDRG